MPNLNNILPTKISDLLERAGIATPKEILVLSILDIKKLTSLCTEDILLLKDAVAKDICPQSLTCDKMLEHDKTKHTKITSGCREVNKILNGGFRSGTIIELYGESGTGKTQIGLQAIAHNWPHCSVYICTEDLFPVKRFEEVKKGIPSYSSDIDYGKNIFVEHITDSKDLLSCIRVRLPKLLVQNTFSLVVIDSVAAPFRVDSTNYVQRAEELRELAILLINLAQEHNLAVLCINQVTASFDGSADLLPSLGLAWSNMISTRLCLKKTTKSVSLGHEEIGCGSYNKCVRELSVIFASDLSNSVAKFIITPSGILGVS